MLIKCKTLTGRIVKSKKTNNKIYSAFIYISQIDIYTVKTILCVYGFRLQISKQILTNLYFRSWLQFLIVSNRKI